jgi:hypothetical protein
MYFKIRYQFMSCVNYELNIKRGISKESRVQSQARLCGICGGKSSTER